MSQKIRYGEFDPETSDGCTIVTPIYKFLTREERLPFRECCIEHDKEYYYGGPVELRRESDRKFRECVSAHGYPVLAWIMWVVLYLFSGPKLFGIINNPFFWAWHENVVILPKAEEQQPE